MALIDTILPKVKTLSKVDGTTIYDEEITQFIQTQYYMLAISGVRKPDETTDSAEYVDTYATAIAYYYLMTLDEGVEEDKMEKRYHEIVELLRSDIL